MKDIYVKMNTQNILKYWGSKLDVKLDYSEFYDYELYKIDGDLDLDVIDYTKEITYSSLVIDSSCLDTSVNNIKPWEIEINSQYTHIDSCDFTVRRRTERGWTLDFIFNRDNLPWSGGSTFYYWGIKDETDPLNYLDNNLSFSFTNDGRIQWKSHRYSGFCETVSGYTEIDYISSGQTEVLCTSGTSEDFNITVTFKRNNEYTDCDILNSGGSNDLITGWTVTNPYEVLTGATEDYTIVEVLNKKWNSERNNRLGTLKIYLNGKPIYKLNDWEEIIPSVRNSANPIVQVFGGGTSGVDNLHTGTTEFNLLRVKYFEDFLIYPNIKHHYIVSTKPYYNIIECGQICEDNLSVFSFEGILSENSSYLLTENNNVLQY
jgi:hypothetical protein